LWLDDVMRQAERLPDEFRQTPLANYFRPASHRYG
jgi:hypothetical protein